jgi:glycosyltransferase involved in cell wall biosynthesis
MKKPKTLLIHNIIAPYRLPLFDEIALITNLSVAYIQKRDNSRIWSQVVNSNNYTSLFLSSVRKSFFGKNFFFLKTLSKINLKEYDLIVLPDDPTYFVCVIQLLFQIKKNKNSTKLVFWSGNFTYYRPFESKILNYCTTSFLSLIRNRLYKQVDFFWCYSQNTLELLTTRFNINRSRLYAGLQGYPDILIKHPKIINFKDRYDANKLIFLGYTSPRKGINILIDAYNDMKSKDKRNINLQIIGSESDYLKSLLRNNKEIVYHGYLESEDKFNCLNECKVLILPSYSDPWGWVVNEAMAIGLPVIVTEGVMSKEMIIDEKLICKTGDKDSLKESIQYLLNYNFDDYLTLSKHCIEQSKKHNLDKSINSFKELVKNV